MTNNLQGDIFFGRCAEERESLNDSWEYDVQVEKVIRDASVGENSMSEEKTFSVSGWSSNSSTIAQDENLLQLPPEDMRKWGEEPDVYQNILNYADINLTREEQSGLLTERIIASCSNYLSICPGIGQTVLAKVVLTNKNLTDIGVLNNHRYLQYVDLSWNHLTDISPLSQLYYLTYLDVSHNILSSVLQFEPPYNLTYVNYSYNEVFEISDLSKMWTLSYLDLSHNYIDKIQGLQELRHLRHLDLSHNKIKKLENLNKMNLADLNLEYNLISHFDASLQTLYNLVNLYLNNNKIDRLRFLQNVNRPKRIYLQNNFIKDISELRYLKNLKNVCEFDLRNNSIVSSLHYRQIVLTNLTSCKYLDQIVVDNNERIAADSLFKYNKMLESARDRTKLKAFEQLNNVNIDLDTLPFDQTAYPLVIFVGPPGSFKKTLAVKLYRNHESKILLGKIHTTRPLLTQTEEEELTLIHLGREEFFNMAKCGNFLGVSEVFGHLYGFSNVWLKQAVEQHKLCLTFMDMEGALCIHGMGIRPYLILTLPLCEQKHRRHLNNKYKSLFTEYGADILGGRNSSQLNKKTREQIVEDMMSNGNNNNFSSSDNMVENVETQIDYEYLISPEEMSEFRQTSPSYCLESWAKKVCENHIDKVLKTRDVYISLHLDNPGLFFKHVPVDKTDEALLKLTSCLEKIWKNTPLRKPVFKLSGDINYQNTRKNRMDEFINSIENEKINFC